MAVLKRLLRIKWIVLILSTCLTVTYSIFISSLTEVKELHLLGYSFASFLMYLIFFANLKSMLVGDGSFSYIHPLEADKQKDTPDNYLVKQFVFFVFHLIIFLLFVRGPFVI